MPAGYNRHLLKDETPSKTLEGKKDNNYETIEGIANALNEDEITKQEAVAYFKKYLVKKYSSRK